MENNIKKLLLHENQEIGFFDKRLVFMGDTPSSSPDNSAPAEAVSAEPATVENNEDKTDATNKGAENNENQKEAPKVSKEADQRNATRSYAMNLSAKLESAGNKQLAEAINAAITETAKAEPSNGGSQERIEVAMNVLLSEIAKGKEALKDQVKENTREQLLATRANLEQMGKKQLVESENRRVHQAMKDLMEKANLTDTQMAGIRAQTKPLWMEATKLYDEGRYDESLNKFRDYEALTISLKDVADEENTAKEKETEKPLTEEEKALLVKAQVDQFKTTNKDKLINTGLADAKYNEAEMYRTRGDYEKAEQSYNEALKLYSANLSALENAQPEVSESVETVDTKKVLGELAGILQNAVAEHGAGNFNAALGRFEVNQNMVAAIEGAWKKVPENQKIAVRNSTVYAVASNPSSKTEVWVIGARLNANGTVSILRTAKERKEEKRGNSQISDSEVQEVLKAVNADNAIELSEVSEAAKKSPEQCEAMVRTAVNEAVKYWAQNGTADDRVLKAVISGALESVKTRLSEEEWKSINYNQDQNWKRVPGTTWDWDYMVSVSNGHYTVDAD